MRGCQLLSSITTAHPRIQPTQPTQLTTHARASRGDGRPGYQAGGYSRRPILVVCVVMAVVRLIKCASPVTHPNVRPWLEGDFGGDFGVRVEARLGSVARVSRFQPDRAQQSTFINNQFIAELGCYKFDKTRHVYIAYLSLLTASGKSLTVPTLLYRCLKGKR